MENETELEKARRRLDDAEAGMKNATESLKEYRTRHPGEYGSTFETLNRVVAETNRVVAETTSRLNTFETTQNRRLPGNYTLLNQDNQTVRPFEQQGTEMYDVGDQKEVQFEELTKKLDLLSLSIAPIVQDFMRKFYYTSDKMTKTEKPSDFKMKLIQYYYGKTRAVTSIVCMFSQADLPFQTIVGGHIFKSCWKEFCMDRLSFEDINDERNGLLLFKPFEFAFDNSHICFLLSNSGPRRYAMRILHPDIKGMTLLEYIQRFDEIDTTFLLRSHEAWEEILTKNEKLSPDIFAATMKSVENLTAILQTKWEDYNNNFLDFGQAKCFDRCLSFQAGMARYFAIDKGWILAESMNLPTEYSDVEESKVKFLTEWRKGIDQIQTIDAE